LADATREYELVLMIDPGLEESARDKLAQDARGRIEAGGALKHEDTWGLRKMAYEIRQRTEADYRWYRFEASPELLEGLDHNLKITDGVLRFRIFKVDPDAPVVAAPPSGNVLSSRPGGDRAERGGRGGRDSGPRGGESRSEPSDAGEPAEPPPAEGAAADAPAPAAE
jgi:small subunit ribosomal protein S6